MVIASTVHLSELIVTCTMLWGAVVHWRLYRRADRYLDELDTSRLAVSPGVLVSMRAARRDEIAWVAFKLAFSAIWAIRMTLPSQGSTLQFWSIAALAIAASLYVRSLSFLSGRERDRLMDRHRRRTQ